MNKKVLIISLCSIVMLVIVIIVLITYQKRNSYNDYINKPIDLSNNKSDKKIANDYNSWLANNTIDIESLSNMEWSFVVDKSIYDDSWDDGTIICNIIDSGDSFTIYNDRRDFVIDSPDVSVGNIKLEYDRVINIYYVIYNNLLYVYMWTE